MIKPRYGLGGLGHKADARPHAHAPLVFAVALGAALAGCANAQDQLLRAERYYQDARYEASLTNLEDMEDQLSGLGPHDRIRYEIACGMTHLRLGQRGDDHRCTDPHHCVQARHWLALARAEAN